MHHGFLFFQVFQISDNSLVSELHFLCKYSQLLQNLRRSSVYSSLTSEKRQVIAEPSIKDLEIILSTAKPSSLGASDSIQDFFQTTKLPSFDESSLHTLSTHCVIGKYSDMFDKALLESMVAFDVAIVSEVHPDVSSDLLHSARASLADVVTVRSSQTGFGICQFADYVLSVIESYRGQPSEMSHSIACMLPLITSPANVDRMKVFRTLYKSVKNILDQASNSIRRRSNDPGGRLEDIFRDAIKLCETHLPRGGLIPALIE